MAVDWDTFVIGPTIAAFGEPVTYSAPAASFAITGVFDEAYLELTPLGRGGLTTESIGLGNVGAISAEMPVLGVQLSAFPVGIYPAQGDTLALRDAVYVVKEVRPDGHGWAKLLLNEVQRGAD